jgi:hypothetical protein
MKRFGWPGKGHKFTCHRCGFWFSFTKIKREWTGSYVCPTCYETRHPQTLLKVRGEEAFPPVISKDADLFVKIDYHDGFSTGGSGSSGEGVITTPGTKDKAPWDANNDLDDNPNTNNGNDGKDGLEVPTEDGSSFEPGPGETIYVTERLTFNDTTLGFGRDYLEQAGIFASNLPGRGWGRLQVVNNSDKATHPEYATPLQGYENKAIADWTGLPYLPPIEGSIKTKGFSTQSLAVYATLHFPQNTTRVVATFNPPNYFQEGVEYPYDQGIKRQTKIQIQAATSMKVVLAIFGFWWWDYNYDPPQRVDRVTEGPWVAQDYSYPDTWGYTDEPSALDPIKEQKAIWDGYHTAPYKTYALGTPLLYDGTVYRNDTNSAMYKAMNTDWGECKLGVSFSREKTEEWLVNIPYTVFYDDGTTETHTIPRTGVPEKLAETQGLDIPKAITKIQFGPATRDYGEAGSGEHLYELLMDNLTWTRAVTDTVKPSIMGNITHGATYNSITFNWPAATDNSPGVHYIVCIDNAPWWTEVETNSYTVAAAPGGGHSIKVRAKDTSGNLSEAILSGIGTALTYPTLERPSVGTVSSTLTTGCTINVVGVTGGVPPYTYSINLNTGISSFTVPAVVGDNVITGLTHTSSYTYYILVTDSRGTLAKSDPGYFNTAFQGTIATQNFNTYPSADGGTISTTDPMWTTLGLKPVSNGGFIISSWKPSGNVIGIPGIDGVFLAGRGFGFEAVAGKNITNVKWDCTGQQGQGISVQVNGTSGSITAQWPGGTTWQIGKEIMKVNGVNTIGSLVSIYFSDSYFVCLDNIEVTTN